MGHTYSTRAWKNEKPRRLYQTLVREFGAPSIPPVARSGGMAIWYSDKLSTRKWMGKTICFSRIVLVDEDLPHSCPAPHSDYLYFYFKANPTMEQFVDTKSISESIGYDGLQKHYWVRCHSIGANVATAKLVSDVLVGAVSISEIYEKKLYSAAIRQASSVDGIANLYDTFCSNIRKHWGEVGMGFEGSWKGAFLSDCQRPVYNVHFTTPALEAETTVKKEHLTVRGKTVNVTGVSKEETSSATFFQDDIGSKTQSIDRTAGTKAQKRAYPKYTDLVQFGITSLPVDDWDRPAITSGTYSDDARAAASAAFLQYDVGSRIQEITAQGGTKEQKINYPRYTDFLQHGLSGVPTDDWTPEERAKLEN